LKTIPLLTGQVRCIIRAGMAATVLVGTCSWTDPTLLKSGWYPGGARTPEERLQYYAEQFPIVEVDSSYYALPAEKVVGLWVERIPPAFVFNIKAFSLFTRHPTRARVLPRDIREAMPPVAGQKASIYERDVPQELKKELFRRFERALLPLDSAGKLGLVLFQFPEWFFPGSDSREYILACQESLPQYRLAVEFRNGAWLNEKNRDRTLDFLRENNLVYTCVDEPQGFRSSMPPVAEATSDIGLIRFHGRNKENWERKGISVAERFQYLYSIGELEEWVPKVQHLASRTQKLHVLFNNCYADYGVKNADDMQALVRALRLPLE
jgi:uncharacterized protein YecE (DUF72 family)